MKNVKSIILSIIVLCISFNCNSQKIECNYNIEISPTEQLKDTAYDRLIYFAKIKANYKITNFKDTCIKFSPKLWVDKLGINDLSLKLFDITNIEIAENYYSYKFNNGDLTINFKKIFPNFLIKCTYSYLGSTFVSIPESNKRDIILLGGEENFEYFATMFFTSKKYKLINNTIEITAPKSKYILSSLIPIDKNNNTNSCLFKFYSDTTKLANSIITILDTLNYKKQRLNIKNDSFDFYIRKNHVDSFNLALKDIGLALNLIKNNKPSHYIKSKINFVEFDWQKNQYAMGRGFDDLVIYDWSFFTKHKVSFIHEFLHTQLNPKSSGDFFINESLIEYLANYFCFFNNKDKFSAEMKKKQESFLESRNDSMQKVSLFKLEENSENSFSLIYDEGPVILNDFAKNIGEDRFVKLSINFFSKTNNISKNKYELFLKYLLENYVNKKCIVELDKKVKSFK